MPFRNVFRNKHVAFITFFSLGLGICLFWVTLGLANAMDIDQLTQMYFQNDNIIIHVTDPSIKSDIDRLSLKELANIKGVDEVKVLSYLSAEHEVQILSNTSFQDYLNQLYDKVPEYQESESNFRKGKLWQTELYGIGNQDLNLIRENLSVSIDPIAFENGNIAIYCMTDEMDTKAVVFGDTVNIYIGKQKYSFITPTEGISYRKISDNAMVSPHYNAPSILVSNSALKKIANETGGYSRIYQIKIHTDLEKESDVLQMIQEITKGYRNIAVDSRFAKEQELKTGFESGKLLIVILCGVLFVIGLINYINTLSISITSRNIEFAALESLGMTKKQLVTMLYKETIIYWMITSLFCIVVGTMIYRIAFYHFEKMVPYVQYKYSIDSLCITLLIMLLCGLAVSKYVFQSLCKNSITERMKRTE